MENQKKQKLVVLIGILLVCLVIGFTLFRSDFFSKENFQEKEAKRIIDYPVISAEELQKKIRAREKITILDTRPYEEFQIEHLLDSEYFEMGKTSINIPQEETVVIIGIPENEQVNQTIFESFKEKKYSFVFFLYGGFNAWKKINGSTISIGDPNSFSDQAKVTYVSAEDLKKIIEEKKYPFTIIDIRDSQSFKNGHLPEAQNIDFASLEKSREKIPLGQEVFVYGENTVQSFQGGVKLYDLNFYANQSLTGGFSEWKTKGFPIVK
jgi:rhodanese-related sulfurtransferase